MYLQNYIQEDDYPGIPPVGHCLDLEWSVCAVYLKGLLGLSMQHKKQHN